MVGERPKRTWGMRAERNDQRWRESKEGLLEETIRREEQETFCFKCGQREAEIRCYSCTHAIFLCTVCDTEVHKSKSFHDRQWFKEFYKPLTPKEHIEDGQVVIIGKKDLTVISYHNQSFSIFKEFRFFISDST